MSDRVPDTDWMSRVEARFKAGSDRMDAMQAELSEISRVTKDSAGDVSAMRDILETGRTFFRFCAGFGRFGILLGKLAAAGMAIWGAFYAATHGGKPPGGH